MLVISWGCVVTSLEGWNQVGSMCQLMDTHVDRWRLSRASLFHVYVIKVIHFEVEASQCMNTVISSTLLCITALPDLPCTLRQGSHRDPVDWLVHTTLWRGFCLILQSTWKWRSLFWSTRELARHSAGLQKRVTLSMNWGYLGAILGNAVGI